MRIKGKHIPIAKISGVILAVLVMVLGVKLLYFQSPLSQTQAIETAHWKLKKASHERRFDLGKFGSPSYVSGNSKDGYMVEWQLASSRDNTKLLVLIGVTPWDIDFTGSPFVLDCRPGSDNETRQSGFGYLCK